MTLITMIFGLLIGFLLAINKYFIAVLVLITYILVVLTYLAGKTPTEDLKSQKQELDLEIQEALKNRKLYKEIKVLEDSLKKLKQ